MEVSSYPWSQRAPRRSAPRHQNSSKMSQILRDSAKKTRHEHPRKSCFQCYAVHLSFLFDREIKPKPLKSAKSTNDQGQLDQTLKNNGGKFLLSRWPASFLILTPQKCPKTCLNANGTLYSRQCREYRVRISAHSRLDSLKSRNRQPILSTVSGK